LDLSLQKRLAAEVLGVGESRIWIDPDRIEDVEGTVTKEEIRRLIKEGVIRAKPVKGNSRARWKERHEKRKKGRRRGPGKRKGAKTARLSKKEAWMNRIRKIRRYLKYLRDRGVIDRKTYRRLYMLAKGGTFKSLSSLKSYMKEQGLLKK